jgi:EmrB/QacA subfamily drug resistance transporter
VNVKRIALIASVLGSGIVLLDSTIVNVALPAIRSDLHGSLAQQQWVVEAYLLLLSSLLLVGGSLGDLLGRRRVFAAGLVGFGICSALCAVAPSGGVLIAARAVQGATGALLVPSTLALIVDTFPDGHERAAAIGSWTAYTGVATVLGPLVGGLLVQLASWRWIFAVNLPLVAVVLVLLRRLPDDRTEPGHVDLTGATLCALGLAGPVFALIEQPAYGWGSPRVFLPLLVGLALLAAFLGWERRSPRPMLPLGLFASRNFSAGNLTTLMLYAGLGVATFFLVLFLQQVGGYRPVEAGLALLPLTLLMFTFSRRVGALADRLGPHYFMAGGPILAGIGLLLLMRVGAGASYPDEVLPAVLVFGIGMTCTVAPLTATVLAAVSPGHAGVASGVNNAVARIAGLLAIAAVGAVVSAAFIARLPTTSSGSAAASALHTARTRPLVTTVPGHLGAADRVQLHHELTAASVHAFHVGVGIAGLLAILGGLIALAGVRNPKPVVRSADCAGGPLAGAPVAAAAGPGLPGGQPEQPREAQSEERVPL